VAIVGDENIAAGYRVSSGVVYVADLIAEAFVVLGKGKSTF